MSNFPTVRYLDAASFTEGEEDVSIEHGKMEAGYQYSRPRFTRMGRRTFSFKYVDMSQTDKETLRLFYRETARGSSNAFNWTHPITLAVHNVRFDESMVLKFSRVGFGLNHRWSSSDILLREV